MKQLLIEGQKELTGEIKISGAKNSVVALIPAAILSDEEVTLYNVPNISDTKALIDIIDLLNGEVVSFNLSRHPVFHQVVDMLEKAFSKIPNNTNLILHSDQGWQYQMKQYKIVLLEKGIIQSMSRKGNCLDNSLMENFFGIMKNEMFYGHEYEFNSLDQLEQEMIKYIEYYNKDRITVKLKGLSPTNYRQQSLI